MRRSILFAAAVAALTGVVAFSGPAQAQDEKVFRYATTGDILGLDPHNNNEGPTNTMKSNIYGRLIHRAWDLSLEPDLATEWERKNPTTWVFTLREGVKFHNGNPFNADDVVYSFKRQSQDTSDMAFAIASIESLEKTGEYEVTIKTDGPDPTLLLNMPNFFIVDKEYMEANDAFEVVQGAGKTNFANTNANGTGPFKLVEWVQDNRVVLEPYEGWWNQANRTDNLDKAIFTPIGNDATRVAALLSGEIDLMYPVPLQDISRLENDANTTALQDPELRTIFYGFDQWRDELLDMPGSGKNPFKDVRVRRAFALAIDTQAIKRVVMRGKSTPTGQMVAPGINGFQPELNDPYGHDPEKAKELLAEAGYPDGFPVTLDCPNDRYVRDEAICTATVPMLERIGIDVTLNAQTKSLHFNKIGQAQGNNTSFFMLGWTPGSFDAHNPLVNLMTMEGDGRGAWNCGRYSNPRVEELTTQIGQTVDEEKRDELIYEAFKIHKDEVGHVPLHQQALAWGVRDDTVADVKQRAWNDVDLRYVTMQ
jgi:peptide/nickel transport system substrate-binding protein